VDNKELCLKPLDLLLAAKLASGENPSASVRELGEALGVSKSSIATSLERLRALSLVKEEDGVRRINRLALRDCFEHAARWLAPARIGDFELGLPTAYALPAMASSLLADEDLMVMPLAHGPMRGRAVNPIHPAAPGAAQRDPALHELLALVDVFRIGRARDRQVAAEKLAACF
jgi:hypothetical protein